MPTFNFTFKIDVYHHLDAEDRKLLQTILSRVISTQEEMSRMSQATEELVGKVDQLTAVVGEVVTTLGEVKAALDAAINSNDMAVVQECSRRIDALMANLRSAEDAADITPDTPPSPPEGGSPEGGSPEGSPS